MKKTTNPNVKKNSLLIALFDEMMRKRPDVLEEIPTNAIVIMQLMGDEKFNAWAQEIAADEGKEHPRIFVEFALKSKLEPSKTRSLTWKQVEAMKLLPA